MDQEAARIKADKIIRFIKWADAITRDHNSLVRPDYDPEWAASMNKDIVDFISEAGRYFEKLQRRAIEEELSK